MGNFVHLHVHTQYSILDGLAKIPDLIKKAYADGQRAMAVTDHGNMYGIYTFLDEVEKFNKANNLKDEDAFKGIVGCEVYVARRGRLMKESGVKADKSGDHLILLAKDYVGYKNLSHLVSLGYTEGFYYKPRVDKEILRQYADGLIACSACLGGELAQTIMRTNPSLGENMLPASYNLEEASKVVEEFKDIFGDDYYIELQRNGHSEQELVNRALFELAEKHNVRCIATNDVHFTNKEDYEAHKMLICINTCKIYRPTGGVASDEESDNGMAYSGEEYFRTAEEMAELFSDHPEVITNTLIIAEKVGTYKLKKDPELPKFEVPAEFREDPDYPRYVSEYIDVLKEEMKKEEAAGGKKLDFTDEFDYLGWLTWKGAIRRYGENYSDEIKERILFELKTVGIMGFPGYFLIVIDFIEAGKRNGIRFGPGRGSAAGSAIAYCLHITNIDPIKYDLLFERFLNPDRISMPDMDIDMDSSGREKTIRYVSEKYGKDQVAVIVTLMEMKEKMAIKDCARAMNIPPAESDRLTKMIPDTFKGGGLAEAIKQSPELANEMENGSEQVRTTLQFALKLDGTLRGTGVHACGVIIGRDNLFDRIPLATAKNSDTMVTQYEGSLVEAAGLLKMDFLGLKTLDILTAALESIKLSKGIEFEIDDIALDDAKTYDLFKKGDTTAIFQFESPGMRKHLRDLKPDCFEDIIAMVALYRPGPMDNIPSFINRKHGREKISYEIPEMGEILDETYGITIYQEQVMLLSRKLASFTRGEADKLRKAMGKKQIKMMEELQTKFLHGGTQNGHTKEQLDKIWEEWKKFASYAFNKSHATCYAFVSYQTAWLKANYTAEFLAANMTIEITDMKKVTELIDEAANKGIRVLPPDINESELAFTVNQAGDIRFGLAALKGVGATAVSEIIEERNRNGKFTNIFDFIERVNLRSCNRKAVEQMAKVGVFDTFPGMHRAQFFATDKNGKSFIEKLMTYGSRKQSESEMLQTSLFDAGNEASSLDAYPPIPECEPLSLFEQLKDEREIAGFYISGHPLESYNTLLKSITNCTLGTIGDTANWNKMVGRAYKFAAIVSSVQHKTGKNGKGYGFLVLEDFENSFEMSLYGEDYSKYKYLMEKGQFLYIQATIRERGFERDVTKKQFGIKVSQIVLLDEAYKLCKKVRLTFNIEDLNENLARIIKEVVDKSNKKSIELALGNGNTPVLFTIYSSNKEFSSEMQSFEWKVNPEIFTQMLPKDLPCDITFEI